MKPSQFEAKTFGLGELITQRKLFRVPTHQRSYSWSKESVETFLDDLGGAFESTSQEYFVGLIVLQGPESGEWILLDGQQRLTTVTMIFSAIRNWLDAAGLDRDATQIENEFLSVRRLGGDVSSRMLLNEENQNTYNSLVVERKSAVSLKDMSMLTPKRSSNRQLMEAAFACQQWVDGIAKYSDDESGARQLFSLASFLENHVKAVAVEVSNDIDAYVLFESLNDRGVELSALDLLKNYLYSRITRNDKNDFQLSWKRLVTSLEDTNPDDFLKVFWTARHGIVQKAQLFRRLRDRYYEPSDVVELALSLEKDSNLLSALSEAKDPLWNDFPRAVRERIAILNVLSSKQSRPVILAAIHSFGGEEVADLLWFLIVVIVRFQIIGRGRTGIMERVFGRLCQDISSGGVSSALEALPLLHGLYITDEQFSRQFSTNIEAKIVRNFYFLWEIERHSAGPQETPSLEEATEAFYLEKLVSIPSGDERAPADNFELGNYVLIERTAQWAFRKSKKPDLGMISQSSLKSTAEAVRFLENDHIEGRIHARSERLAEQAVDIWRLPTTEA